MEISQKKTGKYIGLDLDGVIVDHAAQKMRVAKELGFELKPEETPSDVLREILSKEALSKLKYALYQEPEIALAAPLMEGAREALSALEESGEPFALISRRKVPDLAIRLLKKHELWPRFFSERNAFFVREPEEKNVKAKELGITHYVDDEMNVLEKLHDVPNKFLFDSARAITGNIPYIRVVSWSELLRKLSH